MPGSRSGDVRPLFLWSLSASVRAPSSPKEQSPQDTGAFMNLKKYIVASFILVSLVAVVSVTAQHVANQNKPQGPPMLGLHWAKGIHPARNGGSPDMSFHGGTVLVTTSSQTIFWVRVGPPPLAIRSREWTTGMRASADRTMRRPRRIHRHKRPGGSYGVLWRTLRRWHTRVRGQQHLNFLAEVCKVVPSPVANGYYAVYTDLPRKGNYCAYHSWGSCGSTPVQFAFFWKLDGDAGCDPQSSVAGESQGLAALANVSGHELSEARTDPRGDGWFDSGGAENGDKCAWTFNVPYVTFRNGTSWKIQGEWSNHAYDTSTGYPNSSGQDGCLDGH